MKGSASNRPALLHFLPAAGDAYVCVPSLPWPTNVGKLSEMSQLNRWREEVLAARGDGCQNCGEPGARSSFAIRPESGGTLRGTNSLVFCRKCWRLYDLSLASGGSGLDEALSVWMSRGLHDRATTLMERGGRFKTISDLVRFAMTRFILDPDRFEDLLLYQDSGGDVRARVRTDASHYQVFKKMTQDRGMAVQEALRGLLVMYSNEELEEA